RPDRGESRDGDRVDAPKDRAPDAGQQPRREVPQEQDDLPLPAARNVRLDPTQIGVGGPKAKYRDNVAAIKLYKELMASGRRPTDAEQAILAKYVGWGMFGPVFSDTAEDA